MNPDRELTIEELDAVIGGIIAGGGAVRNVVGIEGGVVSGVIKPRIAGIGAPARRPRHDERYHEAGRLAA